MTDTPRHALDPADPNEALPADAPQVPGDPPPHPDAAAERPLFREDARPEHAPEHVADTVADVASEPTRALPPVDADDVIDQPVPAAVPTTTPAAASASAEATSAGASPASAPAPDGEAAPAPRADGPAVISARGFGVKTHNPAFTGLDIEIPAGRFAAVVGAAGTGKSTLLLALVARMRPVVGSLSIGGLEAMKHPGKARAATAIARIADLVEPEGSLSLDDCLTERTLFDAANPRTREANYLHAARLLGLDAHRGTLFGDLSPLDQTRAALALACVRPSTVIVLDDLDYDVTLAEQRALWDGVAALAADGQPVIAATTERAAVHPDAVVIDLEPEA